MRRTLPALLPLAALLLTLAAAQAPLSSTVQSDLFHTIGARESVCIWGTLDVDEQWCGHLTRPPIFTVLALGVELQMGAYDLLPVRPDWHIGLVPAAPAALDAEERLALVYSQGWTDRQGDTVYYLAYLEAQSGVGFVHFGVVYLEGP